MHPLWANIMRMAKLIFLVHLLLFIFIFFGFGCKTEAQEIHNGQERTQAFEELVDQVKSREERSKAFEELVAQVEAEAEAEAKIRAEIEARARAEEEARKEMLAEEEARLHQEEVAEAEQDPEPNQDDPDEAEQDPEPNQDDPDEAEPNQEEAPDAEQEPEPNQEEVAEAEQNSEPNQEEAPDAEQESEQNPHTGPQVVTGNINQLSGLEISDSVQNGRPLAIMVQNAPGARPQSGLIHADIVFETVVEYGITRFLALYSSYDAEIIGPVRSARTYYAELARSFHSIYTFWGTYHQAYSIIGSMQMDIFDAHSRLHVPYTSAGWRDHSRSSTFWHTAFINTFGIKEDSKSIGYALEGGQSLMQFKVDADETQRGDINDITVNFSSKPYQARFSYDMDTNQYLRFMAGEPHVDHETGQQIQLNNVVVLVTDITGPINHIGHMNVRTTGSHEQGKAYYFIDGQAIPGTWARESIFDPFEFADQNGNPILFNRGATWICLVHSTDRLSF